MPRPPRVVVPGAFYHVFARGNRKGGIIADDHDRATFFRIVAEVVARRSWSCISYCLMTNHYHFLVETPNGNLSAGMHALNGRYANAFNRRHGLSGHVFERRFGAVAAESNWHLLELCRYIVLNPVRAGLCSHPGAWPWSSYLACVGASRPEPFLDAERLLGFFGSEPARARRSFQSFVENGIAAARAA
jgi:putative transposase